MGFMENISNALEPFKRKGMSLPAKQNSTQKDYEAMKDDSNAKAAAKTKMNQSNQGAMGTNMGSYGKFSGKPAAPKAPGKYKGGK